MKAKRKIFIIKIGRDLKIMTVIKMQDSLNAIKPQGKPGEEQVSVYETPHSKNYFCSDSDKE